MDAVVAASAIQDTQEYYCKSNQNKHAHEYTATRRTGGRRARGKLYIQNRVNEVYNDEEEVHH